MPYIPFSYIWLIGQALWYSNLVSDALSSCTAINNGTLFNGDHLDFLENINLLGSIEYWMPYTDVKVEGEFRNFYDPAKLFDATLFYPGEPNGGKSENYIYYKTVQKGAGTVYVMEQPLR